MLAQAKAGFLQSRRMEGVTDKTIRGYAEGLNQFLGYVLCQNPLADVTDITRDHIEQFLNSLRDRKLSDNTVRQRFECVHNFFGWCVAAGCLSESPMRGMKKPRVAFHEIEPFTHDEVKALMAASRFWPSTAIREQAWISLMYNTGLRLGEVAWLKPQQIKGDVIWVVGKGKKERLVAIDPVTQNLLDTWLAGRDGKTVFGLGASGIYKRLKQLAWKAGVQNARPHRLRNTFAVEYLKNGGRINNLQLLLGHASIEMTMRYAAHMEKERALEEHRKMAPFAMSRTA